MGIPSATPIGKATEGKPKQLPGAIKIKLSLNTASPFSGSRSVSIGQGKFDQVGPIQTE